MAQSAQATALIYRLFARLRVLGGAARYAALLAASFGVRKERKNPTKAVLMAHLVDRRTAGNPDPAEVITVTFGGKTFRAGRRTYAHLLWTADRLKARYPQCSLRVLQGCYNTTVAASAGTHDEDSCVDVEIVGMAWLDAQRFLRELGWAAWWRHTGTWAATSSWHIHMVSIGCPGPVGIYVPGQVSDYYAGRSGLAGHVADNTWHPSDINSTVFNYPEWIEAQDMPFTADQLTAIVKAAVEAEIPKIAKAVIDTPVGKDGATLGQIANQTRNAVKSDGK